jgi:predicted DNA-binding protein (UPF0251 family)
MVMKRAMRSVRGSLPSSLGTPVPDNDEMPDKPMPEIEGIENLYKLDPKYWITVSEASKQYGISKSTVQDWIHKQQVVGMLGEVGNRSNVWHVDRQSLKERYKTFG